MDRQGTSFEKIVVSNIDIKNLTPSGERTKSDGNMFHWQQLMSILCKSIANNISFNVTSEIEEAGKFYDVVIFYKRAEKTLCRLIQIKDRENISKMLTFKDLAENKNCQLKTYFDSYGKIKNHVKFEQKYACEIEELIIFMNIDFDDDLKKRMEAVPESIFNEDGFYRMKESSEAEFIKESNVENDNAIREEFFRKLRFAVKQSNEDDLKNDIKHEIFKYLQKHPDYNPTSEHVEMIYVSLLTKIIDLDTNPQVQVINNESYLNWIQEAFSSRENHLSLYHRYNVCVFASRRLRFESDSLEKLEQFVNHNESSLSLVISCADTIFTIQKLIQIFNEQNSQFCLIFDEQVVVSACNIKRDFFSTNPCEYLVVVCKTNEITKKMLKTIKDIHDKIRDSNLNTRIVFVSNPEVTIENYSSIFSNLVKFEDHVAWNDLDKQTKNDVLKRQIVFQGQLIPFKDIDISHVHDLIKDRVLFDIALSDKYEIGKPFHDSKTDGMSYFVPRDVLVRDEIINPFIYYEFDHLFAIENINESLFSYYMSNEPSETRSKYFRLSDETAEEEFQKISHDNKDKNVSWIYFENKMYRWKKSSRSISFFKQYSERSCDFKIKLQPLSNFVNKSVLLIDEPGMGKSTFLSWLATQSIERSPDVWVIKIDLNNHTRYFFDLNEKREKFSNENDVIKFITNTQKFDGFEKALFESYFRMENKLVVLLDGFDEIPPNYKKFVVDLVMIIKRSNKIIMWVTSRPQDTVFLEEQLVVVSYFLSKFTVEDQRHFFKMFWAKHVDKTDSRMKRLDTFVDRLLNVISKSLCTTNDLLLTSIPLKCKMLADVYTEAFIEFYGNETDDTGIPDTVDIFDLYNRFIEIKFQTNIEEKKETDITKVENTTLVDDKMAELTLKYKLLCLGVVFGKENERTLLTEESKEIIKTSLSDIENGIDKCGIVRSVENDIPVFVHRTFAEYFAAMYLRDFVGNTENKTEKCVAFVRTKLFEPEYAVVRRFFDRLTATDDIFKYAINRDKEHLSKILENDPNAIHRTDEFGRNILHLIAGYDDIEDICNYLVESGADTTRTDELFGLKPVEYAAALKVWGNVNELIVANENDETILRSIEDKEELMCTAGEEGWTRLVKYLVEIGKISVDTKNKEGESTLYSAASQGHVKTCQYLIETGANIKNYLFNRNCWSKETAFHIAISEGFVEIVKLFIENDRNIIEDICHKETLLHAAMKSGNVEILRLLIDHGANVYVNSVNGIGQTPLHIAWEDTDIVDIDILLEHGANIEALDNHGFNPLMNYVRRGNVSVIRHLLAKGADMYHCDEGNDTVLHHAILYGLDILEVLIAHDPNIVKKIRFSETLLHTAMITENIEIIEFLIANGANVNGRDENGEVPLHCVIHCTEFEIIDILLKSGTNINVTSYDGSTPLIKYVDRRSNNFTIVEYLVTLGADIRHCPINNRTALHCAAAVGNLEIIKLFIRHDRTIVETIASANTLLHEAMKYSNTEVMKLLIDRGAVVNGKNEKGETPLHIAHEYTSIAAIKLLLKHGADVEARDNDGKTPIMRFEDCKYIKAVQLLRTFIDDSKK